MEKKKRGLTKFDRGWTRYNCLNKGHIIPDWAREPEEGDCEKKRNDRHNQEIIDKQNEWR
jgi:hypothetical protein